MTYMGHVKHGVVILDGNPPLDEGTLVRVEPVAESASRYARGSAQAILRHTARWHGPDEEIDRLLADLRQMKQQEVEAENTPREP